MNMLYLKGSAVPAARFDGLITTESDDEVIVYDETSRHIHHLNRVSAVIWRLCDGTREVGEIAAVATDELAVNVSEETARLALRQLEDAKLLDGALSTEIRGTAQSRRAFMKKAAIAATVPALVSITAPMAASAASCPAGTPTTCSSLDQACCQGNQLGTCQYKNSQKPDLGYNCVRS